MTMWLISLAPSSPKYNIQTVRYHEKEKNQLSMEQRKNLLLAIRRHLNYYKSRQFDTF